MEADEFWETVQPGFRFSSADVGSADFFAQVEAHRYSLEPHITEIANFSRWADQDVLDAGCGIATDGVQFARAGARWVGVDLSSRALNLGQRRFALEGLAGEFVRASLLDLPFADSSFDLVYSHGVIHHVTNPERCVSEFRRVLRPGGTAMIMVYHRNSLNYRLTIMVVKRTLAALLLVPGGIRAVARITHEDRRVLDNHRALLKAHGLRYLINREFFLSNNTDGPGNPLSMVFSRDEAAALFQGFDNVKTSLRYLNLRIYPGGKQFSRTTLGRRLERKLGWHLYVEAQKPK